MRARQGAWEQNRPDSHEVRFGWLLIGVLSALSAFAPLAIDMYLPGLPQLSRDLSSSASLVQLTVTTCMLGLAVGQLFAGPVSDALGRRTPVLAGVAIFAAASALCAISPGMLALLAFRFLQGVAGGAGIVIARAIVRDGHSGAAAARVYALLMVIMAAVPILSPLVGAQLLRVTDWRGIFLALAAIGLALLVAVWRVVPETLPAEARHGGGARHALRVLSTLSRERPFAARAAVLGLSFGAMASYIAGSPFVLQNVYGVSEQTFSVLFAANVLGLGMASQLSSRLVRRVGPAALLRVGLLVCAAGGCACVAVAFTGAGLVPLLCGLFASVSSIGLITPNVTALALADHAAVAGSASGLLGLVQFSCGAAAAPLVGIAGAHSARPMAVAIATCALGSLLVFSLGNRGDDARSTGGGARHA